jgi:hypothetical protein
MGKDKVISVVYTNMSLEQLVPEHRPPQWHYDKLFNSILKHGIQDPLVVHRHNNINKIVFGNTRYVVARDLGYDILPVIVVNFTSSSILIDGEKVTVDNVKSFFGNRDQGVELSFRDGFIIRAVVRGGWEKG